MEKLENYRVGEISFEFNDSEKFNFIDVELEKHILLTNGGYYFGGALHIYGISKAQHHSLHYLNELVIDLYNGIENLLFFAEDLFGNLFCQNTVNSKYYLFNIESTELQLISDDFIAFVDTLLENIDYYTGYSLVKELKNNKSLFSGNRYCPKIPFILGGDYHIDNLVLKSFQENIRFCNSIYKQIKNLPDGTEFEFKPKS